MGFRIEKSISVLICIATIPVIYFATTRDTNSQMKNAMALEPYQRTSVILGMNDTDRVVLRRIDQLAQPDDIILFCGAEDDWNYPLFGNDLSRRLYYTDKLPRARYYLDYFPVNWILVRNDYKEIVDYLHYYPGKYRELHFSTVYGGNRFSVFHVVPQEENPAWVDGIYGDAWSKKEFQLGATSAGKFIVQYEMPPAYTSDLELIVKYGASTQADTALHPNATGVLQLHLPSQGVLVCTLSRSFIPEALKMSSDSRELGIRIRDVQFVPDPIARLNESIHIFP